MVCERPEALGKDNRNLPLLSFVLFCECDVMYVMDAVVGLGRCFSYFQHCYPPSWWLRVVVSCHVYACVAARTCEVWGGGVMLAGGEASHHGS